MMKKTKSTKLALLVAIIVPFLMGCPKKHSPAAPIADTELQSSVDASLLNFMVTDLDMVCSFVGDINQNSGIYHSAPGDDPLRPLVISEPTIKIVAGYNSNLCKDGVVRDGSIFMYYINTNPNARYYRDYQFHIKLRLENYVVNGWSVKVPEGKNFEIYNTLESAAYNPSQTKLSWSMEGSLEFQHSTDASKNMTWNGKLTKTLVNSTDNAVFNVSGQNAINWSKGLVEYKGVASGVTSGDVPYKLSINEAHPLTRDFKCYPEVIGGVESVQPFKTWSKEFHPVKSGSVTFNTGDKYPREIYYGNEGNPELPAQCDNSGEVLIKGNSYKIDFQ